MPNVLIGLEKIQTDGTRITVSSNMDMPVTFNRQYGQLFDLTENYLSLEDIQTYISTPRAYVGQIIKLIEGSDSLSLSEVSATPYMIKSLDEIVALVTSMDTTAYKLQVLPKDTEIDALPEDSTILSFVLEE